MRTRTPKYGTRIRCVTDYTMGYVTGTFAVRADLSGNARFLQVFFHLNVVRMQKKNGSRGRAVFS